MPRVIHIVGASNTGKTRLVTQLIPLLQQRGLNVAVIKHCHKNFELDTKGKDSQRFLEAGSPAVGLISPDRSAVLIQGGESAFHTFAERHFPNMDLVLVEGGRNVSDAQKIEVLRQGVSDVLRSNPEQLVCVVSDIDISSDAPVFSPEAVGAIADCIVHRTTEKESSIKLEVDGKPIPLTQFVCDFIENVVLGMVATLKGVGKNPKQIVLKMNKEGAK